MLAGELQAVKGSVHVNEDCSDDGNQCWRHLQNAAVEFDCCVANEWQWLPTDVNECQ